MEWTKGLTAERINSKQMMALPIRLVGTLGKQGTDLQLRVKLV
jgi:hypothetical protein